ncbi:TRAP transporter permease [Azospirillum halopraeferens]|uniref:TRAP transporter permease n=1 Tax=Azospirillum halopraeferens TaxID=34010 RepID=UPI0006842028|nr:TRAP transporter fused permease subunit [Azospirillum halopraeferens]
MTDRVIDRLEELAGVMIVLLSAAYAADLQRYAGIAVYDAQLLAAGLSLALTAGFLAMARRAAAAVPRAAALAAAAVTIAVGAYVAVAYVDISMEAPYLPGWLVALSAVLFGGLMLNLRPSAGLGILVVVLVFLAYGLLGHLIPGELGSRQTTPSELLVYLAVDANGMLGTALKVAVVIVVPYLLFGQLLSACGASDFFNDLALAGMGRSRGGPAKVAVTASALFGSISGSAVGNVVGTGVVTIPMMKRAGFAPTYAGAVEAVASTGGQLVPPVMGAAAFIMADMIGIDYVDVMLAALPAALLYYLAIFINIDLSAGRRGIRPLAASEIPRGMAALKRGWHFIIPFAVLFYTLFAMNMRPERAAILSVIVLLVGSLLFSYRGRRLRLPDIWRVVGGAGRASLDLLLVCAAAGVIIGVLNISGLAFNLTLHIIAASGNSVIVLALITAVVSIVLGMGMPTVGVYILLATLVAPALVEVGVPVIAAHLFVFYFGLMSMITPPVALASFAAANIAGTRPFATSVEAMKLGWPAYIVPFLFLFAPSLVLQGSPVAVAWALVSAATGIYMVTAGAVGFLMGPVGPAGRAALIAGGGLAIVPAGLFEGALWSDAAGMAVLVVMIAARLRTAVPRSHPPAPRSAPGG